MPRVDPEDDSIRRWVVRRYAYDPARSERRHCIVAAFDNEPDFLRLIAVLREELEGRRAAGQAVERMEHISGVVLEPGHGRRMRRHHLRVAAAKHRVGLPEEVLDSLTRA